MSHSRRRGTTWKPQDATQIATKLGSLRDGPRLNTTPRPTRSRLPP